MSNVSAQSVKTIVSALAAASKAVKELPAAPTFDPAPLRAAFEAAQLPEKFIASALAESEKKFISTHGDTSERFAKTVLSCVADSLGGIEELATICQRMAKEARASGKVTVTASEFSAALKGEKDGDEAHREIAEKAADMRKDGKAWSEIEADLNLSPATRSALYMVSKEFKELFPVKSE